MRGFKRRLPILITKSRSRSGDVLRRGGGASGSCAGVGVGAEYLCGRFGVGQHRPYSEVDNIPSLVAYVLADGTCVEDMGRMREDADFLDSLGMDRFPDPTTSGDFLRRRYV